VKVYPSGVGSVARRRFRVRDEAGNCVSSWPKVDVDENATPPTPPPPSPPPPTADVARPDRGKFYRATDTEHLKTITSRSIVWNLRADGAEVRGITTNLFTRAR